MEQSLARLEQLLDIIIEKAEKRRNRRNSPETAQRRSPLAKGLPRRLKSPRQRSRLVSVGLRENRRKEAT